MHVRILQILIKAQLYSIYRPPVSNNIASLYIFRGDTDKTIWETVYDFLTLLLLSHFLRTLHVAMARIFESGLGRPVPPVAELR